ncbi:MAG: hypothetical protein AAF550_14345 [Myxococcota bacterium]
MHEFPVLTLSARALRPAASALISCCLWVGCSHSSALAQDEASFQLPPEPREQPSVLVGEVHTPLVMPVSNDQLCPGTVGAGEDAQRARCLFRLGGGIGGSLERRWNNGFAILTGAEFWFLDGNGVYELGVLQLLYGGVRYGMLPHRMVHPYVEITGGGLLFGDSFRVDSAGGAFGAGFGIEIELSAEVSLRIGNSWWFFSTTEFEADSDGLKRSVGSGLDVATTLQIGLAIFQAP